MRPLLLALALSPLVLAGCARTATVADPADPLYFDTYDADGDGFVTDDEFGVGFADTPYYRGYDTDNDGVLDRNEFDVGTADYGYDYDLFDADRDGFVTDREYYGGVYTSFDTDNDGVLDRNEFGVGFGTYPRY